MVEVTACALAPSSQTKIGSVTLKYFLFSSHLEDKDAYIQCDFAMSAEKLA